MARWFLVLLLLWPVVGICQLGDDVRDAFERGDYATILRECRPLAEQGVAMAQYNLGQMYYEGQGVPQDQTEAVRWFRLASEQGHNEAERMLSDLTSLSTSESEK